uniref:Uncharacterized protein n=1 Tax=Romanomermis culicivorax TaxID=13658 RepID=A0A915JG02_ROMCU
MYFKIEPHEVSLNISLTGRKLLFKDLTDLVKSLVAVYRRRGSQPDLSIDALFVKYCNKRILLGLKNYYLGKFFGDFFGHQGYLYLPFPTEQNGTECNRYNVTERKGNCRSVRFGYSLYT